MINTFSKFSINSKYHMFAAFIRASIGLAYVPLDRIESEALGILKKMAEELGKRHKSFAIDYLAYINRYWVHGQYHPSTWNYYQKHGVSTNNHAEGKHLNIFSFDCHFSCWKYR